MNMKSEINNFRKIYESITHQTKLKADLINNLIKKSIINTLKPTVLGKQIEITSYNFNYDDTKILRTEKNYNNPKMYESLFLKANYKTVNLKTGTNKLFHNHNNITQQNKNQE